MTHPTGTVLNGIVGMQDLRDRCVIDPITDCWHYSGCRTVWMPWLRAYLTLGAAVGFLATGERPAPGVMWHSTCGNTMCANPAHRMAGNRSTQNLTAAKKMTPLHRSNVAKSRRKDSKVSDGVVAMVRASDEPLAVLAERTGMSTSWVSKVRLGHCRREYAAPEASVFTWRPAA